jgi:hypothetical protein
VVSDSTGASPVSKFVVSRGTGRLGAEMPIRDGFDGFSFECISDALDRKSINSLPT